MQLWVDADERRGPEAMAVDEWLLESAAMPVLRVYRWLGNWGSVGYFGDLGAAMRTVAGVEWVRRWTGGGTVDHRSDWTYSVVVPAGEPLAGLRGAESYRLLHAALAAALVAEGVEARLSSGAQATGAAQCFDNPVSHDLIGRDGRKLAGAGQRRTRCGLLHQGSVAAGNRGLDFEQRAQCLAAHLARDWSVAAIQPPAAEIAAKVAARYGCPTWTSGRARRIFPPSATC